MLLSELIKQLQIILMEEGDMVFCHKDSYNVFYPERKQLKVAEVVESNPKNPNSVSLVYPDRYHVETEDNVPRKVVYFEKLWELVGTKHSWYNRQDCPNEIKSGRVPVGYVR